MQNAKFNPLTFILSPGFGGEGRVRGRAVLFKKLN